MSDAFTYTFHGFSDREVRSFRWNKTEQEGELSPALQKYVTTIQQRKLSYRFYNHFHPYVDDLIRRLIEKSVRGLQAIDTEYQKDGKGREIIPSGKPKPENYELYKKFFKQSYDPNTELVPESVNGQYQYPVKDLDFTSSGAYAVYNWELFYHVPLTIAIHLSKNQRFDEAQQWFHYIFDPTDDSEGPTPERFWKVKPFQTTDVKMVEEILLNLSTGKDLTLQKETINNINNWKDNPFRPHLIARYRQSAYMFKTVMAYLDNLIDWGDSLFRQDTGESINEATQLYVLAANILGPRPQAIPKKGSVRPQTYASLRNNLSKFGNALRDLETDIPFNLVPAPNHVANSDRSSTINSIGKALYFCIPRNDKIMEYWDTVADRLFKIHNSLNIQGIFRQPPLFEPPIDPALLAKATAAGLDIGAVISGVNQPLPLVRFQFLIQKATEICQEVKSLGNNLLSAIEKEDNEAIAILRAKHEQVILKLAEIIKYSQWQEAIKAREGLEKSRDNAIERYKYYESLLGKKENAIEIPELEALDTASLEKMKNFKASEPEMSLTKIEVDIDRGEIFVGGGGGFIATGDSGGKIVSSYEREELKKLEEANHAKNTASRLYIAAKIWRLLPSFGIKVQPFGFGGDTKFGGEDIAEMIRIGAEISRAVADLKNYEAGKSAKIGSYARREQEWAFQRNLATGEINQIFKQLRAAQIREYIAEKDWKNHQQQIRHAQEIEYFLKGEETQISDNKKHKKTSTQSFYVWMRREVKGLYGQVFQFAFDIAKKAERALQHELGDPKLSFLQFGYLAGKEGLLAGEKLYLDLKRMEMAYHDLNQREYELTKHISLLQVNPLALLQLRSTGRCTVSLPEELFDMDCPGHYFRRIKNVAVSIPCVTGPYTSINCTLTLTTSRIRKSALIGDGYARNGAEDSRFSDYFGSLQSIVTSTGQNDTGLFETNLRDERYLPFENSGVISEWELELPGDPSSGDPLQFDYDTISDIIIHIRYMAREGGGLLKSGAIAHLKDQIDLAQTVGSIRLFSIRDEFLTEWAKFKSINIEGTTTTAELKLDLRAEHYPFWSQGRLEAVKRIDFFAKTAKNTVEISTKIEGTEYKDTLVKDQSLGDLRTATLTNIPLPSSPISPLTLNFNDNSMEDMWLALTWGKAD